MERGKMHHKEQVCVAMEALEEVTGESTRFDYEHCAFETTDEQPQDWETLQSFVRALRFVFCKGGLNDKSNKAANITDAGRWCRDKQEKEWAIRNQQALVLDNVTYNC